jgi:hypothetical protein
MVGGAIQPIKVTAQNSCQYPHEASVVWIHSAIMEILAIVSRCVISLRRMSRFVLV